MIPKASYLPTLLHQNSILSDATGGVKS
jgi:hypothetical protein